MVAVVWAGTWVDCMQSRGGEGGGEWEAAMRPG